MILLLKMFRCHLCQIVFKDIDRFIRHFPLLHKFEICNRYVCTQNDCDRIFQNIHVFKCHLITNHSQDNERSFDEQTQLVDLPVTCNNNHRNFDIPPSHLFISEDEFNTDFDDTEENLCDLKHRLQHEAAKFTSSFYKESSVII